MYEEGLGIFDVVEVREKCTKHNMKVTIRDVFEPRDRILGAGNVLRVKVLTQWTRHWRFWRPAASVKSYFWLDGHSLGCFGVPAGSVESEVQLDESAAGYFLVTSGCIFHPMVFSFRDL
jgi:hypothetical protein